MTIRTYTYATLGKEYGNHTYSCGAHLLNPEDEKCGTPCLYYGSIDEVMRSGVCDGKGNCVKHDKKLCAVEDRPSLKIKKGNAKSFIFITEK